MTLGPQQIWETTLGQLQLQVPRSSYDTWFKGTRGISLEEESLTIAVATPFAAEWLERRMAPLILKTVAGVATRPLQVHFQVVAAHEKTLLANDSIAEPVLPPSPYQDDDPVIYPPGGSFGQQLLNQRYTFSSFVVGKDNQLAHAAAAAVAERPGHHYNPLFIYSDAGLGKTHLLHAIASHVTQKNLTPVYVTAERFTNEFIMAIRERKTEGFRAKYRSADVLLMDDIQFLAGKEQTQEGFFHTFNELHIANRQIVVACDRPPKSVSLLEDRLRSRFEGGLIADIQPPQLETRLAILHAKATALGYDLSSEVALAIAQRGAHSIRELEGHLNRVLAMAQFLGKPLSSEIVDIALPSTQSTVQAAPVTVDDVLQHVASYYKISPDLLCSRRQGQKATLPQRVALYILARLLHRTPQELGALIGNLDRTAVRNTLKQMETKVTHGDPPFKEIQEILGSLTKASEPISTK